MKLEEVQNSLKDKRKEFTLRLEMALEESEKLRQSFENVIDSVKEKNRVLEEQSKVDPLTGIHNRRVFEESIEAELQRFIRYNQPFSLIFFDIDRFKDINDNYGHDAGDRVLKAIAKRVNEMIRKPDIFARYGGEEFVIILPEITIEHGVTVSEKLRKEIENAVFEYEGERVPITISIGITEVNESDKQYESIVSRADSYMYQAKEKGRNKVVSDQDMNNESKGKKG
jgi:diguanylate cyclase